MSEVKTVEERLSAIESNIEWLTGGYKDLAYEFTNNLVKRVEGIREEVSATLFSAQGQSLEASHKAMLIIENGIKSLEEARDAARVALVQDVAAEVVATIGDGSHALVSVAGNPHPVLKRVK